MSEDHIEKLDEIIEKLDVIIERQGEEIKTLKVERDAAFSRVAMLENMFTDFESQLESAGFGVQQETMGTCNV